VRLYRHYFWQRNAFAHNHLLDLFLSKPAKPDLVIANGDYSCDSAFVGVSDPAAFASAAECLEKLRSRFAPNFAATFGDHELGKKPLGVDLGGLRIESYHRACEGLGLEPFWQRTFGHYVLIGVVSTLVALPVYEPEALADELAQWRELREKHLEQIRAAFSALKPGQRVLLFCHDPTALPFLWREQAVRDKLPQVERTIIGHLHSNLILLKSRLLAGMPVIRFLGHTPTRLTSALRDARCWKFFRVLLCPSLSGIELLRDGGYYTAQIDPLAREPATFQFHRLRAGAGTSGS
jgi:calcineurin-like phosphoesterase family protein